MVKMRTTFAVFLGEYLPSEIPVVRWRFGKVICSGGKAEILEHLV